ncbi:MAG: bifunctional (p)ppGpp synthetase/guanosine-3',5'-bis(diphosphate) 3'-pyrophosphohydrolase [Caldiserica bacterium]|nr:bifunctional (p)ppGpp synthetase/guanosine-3',5'-bis(diphosphate) 3'-pyrophosphohydrolase [Caldisericota bacterium]MDH7562950.1 bifunctional (p)ppGpp synthetase/guanosine-3',5'-bis(diphosphate) 3'-pyrophosphohydrolase [Caldisericota bacterium]
MEISFFEEKLTREGRDPKRIREAYEFALKAHALQRRESGEPFINHPLQVASVLLELEADEPTIIAALLHDVVEDTELTLEDIQSKFGEEVALLVDGLTKISGLSYASKEERRVENLRKILLAMARDVRVVLIKLADRLHNMRTLSHLSQEKQKEIAKETLEIYAPLASRLGIYKLKWELEDLSFRYLEPHTYFELAKKIQKKRSERERILNEIKEVLQVALKEQGIKAEIQYRAKHLYSVHQKMERERIPFEEIYDLLAMRIIVDETHTCYEVLGLVHSLFTPIPGRLKDYIAMPKPNMYQSLHTVVIGPQGDPVEFQIRTWEMHKTAELGIAAHWRYKEGTKRDVELEQKLAWLRELLEWQKELTDSRQFMERVKVDLFSDEVLVFTPKGEVINLPQGATPIDFAYKIHTQIGNHCAGARVNGKLVPLDFKLRTGDRVEIITKQNASPSLDWLQFVRATSTKEKIKAYFRQRRREESIQTGKQLFEKYLKKFINQENIAQVFQAFNLENEDDLYLFLGQGQITPQQVLNSLKRAEEKPEVQISQEFKPSVSEAVSTEGLIMRIARCCHPLPGDEIVGYISQGKGVSIHRKGCRNLKNFPKERLIPVTWPFKKDAVHPVQISILTINQPGALKEVSGAIAEESINIREINAFPISQAFTKIKITLELNEARQLNFLIKKLNSLKVVKEVQRV